LHRVKVGTIFKQFVMLRYEASDGRSFDRLRMTRR
jgi:hypothetical protein